MIEFLHNGENNFNTIRKHYLEYVLCANPQMLRIKAQIKVISNTRRLGGSRWTSGRTGPLTRTAQKSPGSKNHSNGSVSKVG
jgi:hypothetical protein